MSTPLNPFQWAYHSVLQRGPSQTFRVALSTLEDLVFDWRYGTDTRRRVDLSRLEFQSRNKCLAKMYGATKAQPFLRLVEQLALPKTGSFVDIGCGKGRVLMLAALAGFRNVVGLEFSPELCTIARHNWNRFQSHTPTSTACEVLEVDATQYAFQSDQTVFFLYDPFLPAILEQVIRRIGESLEAHPRKAWLIYGAPKYHETVAETRVFQRHQGWIVKGTDYRVYETLDPSSSRP